MITSPGPGLTFGALNLIGTAAELTAQGYRYEALGDNMDWGNPVPIDEKVISWLQDGALVARKGYDNREMFLRVQVVGTDSDKMAVAEAPLFAEIGKPNLLTWTPPDGDGEPCVFSVVMSSLEFAFNDIDEVRELRVHTYGIKIQAEPFVRAEGLVTVTKVAPTGTQVITTVDDCTATTGWAVACPAAVAPSVSVVSGAVRGHATTFFTSGPASQGPISLTRTGLTADITTDLYIRVETHIDVPAAFVLVSASPSFTLNGTPVPIAVQEGDTYWLDTTGLGLGGTLTSFKVQHTVYRATSAGGAAVDLFVSDISRSNVLGTQSTNRQLGRTLEVAGSARTQGSLSLTDAADALGTTLVYTAPTTSGLVQPNLRTFLSSANTETGDAGSISGFTSELDDLHTFDIPVTGLAPGGYLLLARLKHGAVADQVINWAARSRQGSTDLGDAQEGEAAVTLVVGEFTVVTIAKLNLPPTKIGPAGVVRIELEAQTYAPLLDEAWLFNIETGRLSWVECGDDTPAAGGPASTLWLDAATVASPRPSVWLGTETDRSDSYHAASELVSLGDHQFTPPSMNVFTVTSNSTAADVTLSHYPRFFTHVMAS